ncbi:MAG: single-stranded DNA-binding protein [Bacteroidaceae bacterium]|nr:single-stranded DNA-binding protein [Bacteroidaceae bacterium]
MSVNKIILLGNVGKEPEVRYLDSGVAVANITLATTDRAYTLKNGTQVPEHTEWHNIVLWRGLAEVAEKYVHKGDKLYVEGKLRTRNYDDKNGVTRYITEVFADSMEMLSPKGQSTAGKSAPAAPAESTAGKPAAAPAAGEDTDDLPF